jgi:hypothetical protein
MAFGTAPIGTTTAAVDLLMTTYDLPFDSFLFYRPVPVSKTFLITSLVGVRKRAAKAVLLEAVCLLPRTVLWALVGLDIMLTTV